jgi:hypothetical protein
MFERVLTVTSSTVDVMAKSFQRPRKVHFSRKKRDISVFQQGMSRLRHTPIPCNAARAFGHSLRRLTPTPASPHTHSYRRPTPIHIVAPRPFHVAPQSFAEWACGAIVIAIAPRAQRFSFCLFIPFSVQRRAVTDLTGLSTIKGQRCQSTYSAVNHATALSINRQ